TTVFGWIGRRCVTCTASSGPDQYLRFAGGGASCSVFVGSRLNGSVPRPVVGAGLVRPVGPGGAFVVVAAAAVTLCRSGLPGAVGTEPATVPARSTRHIGRP